MFVSGVTDAENMAKKPEKLSARYTATLTTPAILPVAKIGKPFAGLPGTLASMAVSGLSATAGFEKRGTDKCDRVLTKSSLVYPAGSVFFIESGDPKAKPPPAIGTQKHRGYGQYLIGEWK